MTRKLAAILSADVAGYSRLMGEDEEATVRTVTVYRDVIAGLVQQHRGRVVDSPGDNVLAEFASVLDAVQCAVAIQRELNARNAALPLPRRMQFRLGINLGDVILDGERIYGDGVNIAARLEGLAEAGGICISGTVYDQVATKLPLTYKFLGRQTVKNIARPVRAYRIQAASEPSDLKGRLRNWRRAGPRLKMTVAVVGLLLLLGVGVAGWRLFLHPSWPTAGAPAQQTAARALPDKPSIAVLPFVNMSGDPEQEYFSDGMTEDLITQLSWLSGLLVIARNSVFTYKGKPVKPEQVSRELGVRYMLEGSVRKANHRLRITAQLVDATTGYHLWAQYYDRDLHDIFAVQEEIARRITRALAVRLTMEEEKHMGRPYTSSQVAWEYFMRGAELYRRFTPQDNAHARELFEKAVDLDPEFARAYANLAATHRQDWTYAWTQDRETSEELAYRLAQKAVELARQEIEPKPSLPYALQQWALVLLYRRQHQDASDAAEEAVQRNPNYADGFALWALVLTYRGEPEEALRKTQEAIRLNPNYPFLYDYHRGQAYYVWGFLTAQTDANASRQYYQQAEAHLQEALRRNKNFRSARTYLVAVLSELGRQDEAMAEMAILRESGRLQPSQGLERFKEYIQQTHPYEMVEGKRLAPEITTHLIDLWRAAE
jgi:TolB-like protein/class 3 adenylate cyclase/Tfp pilus assembly protein PilF